MKKGQVTIIVIIALVIVGAILVFFLLVDTQKIRKPAGVSIEGVNSYTKQYIEYVALDCLKKIGSQGGYYKIPEEIQTLDTVYWYYEGINFQPFLNSLENESSECVTSVLKNTTDVVLKPFNKDDSIRIDKDGINSRVLIRDKFVNVNVDYPIIISKGSSISIISKFDTSFIINFYELYELATGIVNYASTPDFDTCEPAKCSSDNINFTFFNENGDLIIKGQTFIVYENDSYTPYELKFAIKRPIKEAFGDNKKHLAVLYQDDKDLPTFGAESIKSLSAKTGSPSN